MPSSVFHIDVVRLFQLMLGCTECRRLGATLGFAAGWEENAANKPSTCVRVCVCVCVCVCVRACGAVRACCRPTDVKRTAHRSAHGGAVERLPQVCGCKLLRGWRGWLCPARGRCLHHLAVCRIATDVVHGERTVSSISQGSARPAGVPPAPATSCGYVGFRVRSTQQCMGGWVSCQLFTCRRMCGLASSQTSGLR